MTKARTLESRCNVFTLFTGCAQIYHQRWYICALSEGQVSLAMDNASKLPYTIPLRKLRLLPLSEALLRFVNICVQTKAKVRLLSAHKVYPCTPLPYWQNVGVAYG